jgi:Rps23 Pro-64 3,4-dihydroxylase Tpa1-like proline 4-hydroxylase
MNIFQNKKSITIVDGLFTRAEIEKLDTWFQHYNFWGLGHDQEKYSSSYSSLCRSLKWDQWVGVHAILGDVCDIMTDRLSKLSDIKVPYFHRCLINCFKPGDSPMFHPDSPSNSNGRTFMVYPNKAWELNWGGYTVFADKEGNVYDVANPKPGRIVIFDGSIEHCGVAPTRAHQGKGRYSIAYQDPEGTYDPSKRKSCKPEDIEKTSFESIYGNNWNRLRHV